MSNAWSLFIILLVAVNIGGSLWLLWATSRRAPGEDPSAPGTTGHTWDGDLEELNSPLPRWWLWLFYATVAFSLAYLVLYPGLGRWQGTLGWTQERQWQEQVAAAEAVAAPLFERLRGLPLEALAEDEDAMRIARNLFANNCATCHGADARGARGFPNLTDSDWLHGRDAETVFATIAYGRNGVMPPWGEALGPQAIEQLIAYVRSLSGLQAPPDMAAAGQPLFQRFCTACHGADGSGMPSLGAPDLTDTTWLYGSDAATLRDVIARGRNNAMPGHLTLLGEDRVRLLTAWVLKRAPVDAVADDDAGDGR